MRETKARKSTRLEGNERGGKGKGRGGDERAGEVVSRGEAPRERARGSMIIITMIVTMIVDEKMG